MAQICLQILLIAISSSTVLLQKNKGKDWTDTEILKNIAWPCPWNGVGCRGRSFEVITTVDAEVCGSACNEIAMCKYWTFNGQSSNNCFLYVNCYPHPMPNSVSGKKGCPPPWYTDSASETSVFPRICGSCGTCSSCCGVCVPFANICVGGCLGRGQNEPETTTMTAEQAKMAEAMTIADGECSADCDESSGTKDRCFNCVAGEVKDFDFPCLFCIRQVVPVIISCRKEYPGNLIKAVKCVASKVPKSCLSCLCDIICKVAPSLCKICYDISQSNIDTDYAMVTGEATEKCIDTSWFPYQSLCYKLFLNTKLSQDDAENTCAGIINSKNDVGTLVVIDSAGIQSQMKKIISSNGLSACTLFTIKDCIWSAGTSTNDPPTSPTNGWQWAVGEPFNRTVPVFWVTKAPIKKKGMTGLFFNFGSNGRWSNTKPGQTMNYMCQIPQN